MRAKNTGWWSRALGRAALLVAVVLGSGNGDVAAQAVLDLCGCAGTPGLQPFNAGDPATYPPGTQRLHGSDVRRTIVLPCRLTACCGSAAFTASGTATSTFVSRKAARTTNPP